ncbi:MAG: hypothetical protein EZS28_024813 [Streblomastix strix]|uniref:Uncharacterized protein n=1 Tax=Streblomastix strix TaxID=222440 RepID=A0A5J4VAN6_9EUKA|nr:MAG: hypothetical protein EZS28_024813 [Streblomastix strix]
MDSMFASPFAQLFLSDIFVFGQIRIETTGWKDVSFMETNLLTLFLMKYVRKLRAVINCCDSGSTTHLMEVQDLEYELFRLRKLVESDWII